MLPFLLGHEILFQRFGVAWSIENPGAPEYSDLIMGVLICSRPPAQMLSEMKSRWFPLRLWTWGKICGAFDPFEKARLFQDYMREGRDIPKIWDKSGSSRVNKTSLAESLYSMLRIQRGKSHDEAMNTELWPLLRSMVADAEARGAIDIRDDSDEETAAEGLKFLNEVLAGKHFKYAEASN
jgi:hypothetical protein